VNGAGARLPGITELPPSAPGMRIGLFGGSFNPAHEGHRLVAEQALIRLELDVVWILVTPGNPLKDHSELAPLGERVRQTRQMLAHPAIRVTGFEAERGITYSYQTVDFLTATLADRRFVWIMGADNLASFHRWERWQDIAAKIPLAVYVRPGSARPALASPAAHQLARHRISEMDAPLLAGLAPPAWVYLRGLVSPLSSSAIRARRQSEQLK
jgi:nicotinate-nucleotide adenylyltransferase